jgi:thiamine biosynthesis lipoprotein
VWGGLAALGQESRGQLRRFSRSEPHMGVEFEVVLYADEADRATKAMGAAMSRIAQLDKALSDYDLESELSKLSATSATQSSATSPEFPVVRLSDDLWNVLSFSQNISRQTAGAFDVTVGPLTKLWRRARRWKELPQAEQLAVARGSVGYQFVRLNEEAKTAQLLKSNMRLDLGGIAKGYAAEEAVKTVKASGIDRVLVRASGDIFAGNPPPDERGWRVGIAPLNPDDPPQRFIELANMAISTSGDARQHLIVDGRRYSHILDPRTGAPVSGRSSVTVIAPAGMLADSFDTAISVLGPQQGLTTVKNQQGVELLMVYEDDLGKETVVESPGFKRFLTAGRETRSE